MMIGINIDAFPTYCYAQPTEGYPTVPPLYIWVDLVRFTLLNTFICVKIKVTLEQATKAQSGGGGRDIVLFFLTSVLVGVLFCVVL